MPFDVYSQAGADAKFLTEVDGGDPDAAPLPVTLRRGTTAEWTAANPVLSAGEPGVDLDTGEQRLGDGVTAWSSLPITGDLAPALAAVDDLHLDGTPAPMRTAGDGLTARRWWQHSGTSGYLDHLTAGAGSGGYLAGYGTDYGAAGGIYVSAKNAGIGVAIQTHASASNMGLRVTAFNKTSYPAHLDLYKGALPWRIAKVKGEAYADGVANGTATFTSATAAFTAGDIGKTLTQTTSRDEGMVIPAGATIAAVGSATSVTLSAPATGTGTAINFLVAGRVPLSTEVLTEWADDDNAPILRIRNRDAVDLYRPDRALEGTGSNRSMVYRQFDRVVFKRWGGAAYQSNAIAVSGTNGHLALIGYDDGTTEPGSETGSVEMIKFKKNQLGFFGATPIARPALGASATDTGTTLALANGIRALLINYGLATA